MNYRWRERESERERKCLNYLLIGKICGRIWWDTLNGVTFAITTAMTNLNVFYFHVILQSSATLCWTHQPQRDVHYSQQLDNFSFSLSLSFPSASFCSSLPSRRFIFLFFDSLSCSFFFIVCYFVEYICIDFTECFGR